MKKQQAKNLRMVPSHCSDLKQLAQKLGILYHFGLKEQEAIVEVSSIKSIPKICSFRKGNVHILRSDFFKNNLMTGKLFKRMSIYFVLHNENLKRICKKTDYR